MAACGPGCEGEPPGALGQSCDAPIDCSEYLCVEGTCTYTCDVSRNIHCPDGYRCDTVDGTQYVCISIAPPDDGGCCSTSHERGAISAALLSLFVALRLRRRATRDSRR